MTMMTPYGVIGWERVKLLPVGCIGLTKVDRSMKDSTYVRHMEGHAP